MNKTVSSVIDDINEWNGPNGTIYYVTAIFSDESVGSAGKKNYDAALEVQGLLREAIGVEQDFTLESKGQTKTGRDKFNIKGFGTPGGAATYTAPGSPGTAAPGGHANMGERYSGRSPERIVDGAGPSVDRDVFIQERMDRRTALMQAVDAYNPADPVMPHTIIDGRRACLTLADEFYEWLRKTSDASSAYEVGSGTASPVDATNDQADASEDRGGEVESKGKEPASPPHIHDWQPHPNLRNKLKCECGEVRSKASV